jgi:hypothetical protein
MLRLAWRTADVVSRRLSRFDMRTLSFVVCAVYPDGRVCISILHNPGDDPNGYETAAERWSPVQSVSAPQHQQHDVA